MIIKRTVKKNTDEEITIGCDICKKEAIYFYQVNHPKRGSIWICDDCKGDFKSD